MSTMAPQEYRERTEPVPPFKMHIMSYRLGDVFYCIIDNVDPELTLPVPKVPRVKTRNRRRSQRQRNDWNTRRPEYRNNGIITLSRHVFTLTRLDKRKS